MMQSVFPPGKLQVKVLVIVKRSKMLLVFVVYTINNGAHVDNKHKGPESLVLMNINGKILKKGNKLHLKNRKQCLPILDIKIANRLIYYETPGKKACTLG